MKLIFLGCGQSESESDWYTASVNNDCYAEAWGVSKERVH